MYRISSRVRFSSTSFILFFTFWCVTADAQMLVHFDLPAQPLAQSLKAIGTATNTDVGFSATQVAGLLAPPLKADLTVDGALMRVLVGTGLRPKHLDDHTIVIAATEAFAADSQERRLLWARASPATEPGDQIVPSQAGAAANNSTDNPSSSNAEKKDLEEIVVTGTHIHGTDNKINPIIIVDQAQIERSGYSSTSDLLRALPQNFASGDTTQDGQFGNGPNRTSNTDFSSGVNLRGLGSSSTLVLLDGHRIAPAAYGTVVDVSAIPLAAIDRVEILTDGSSAIYGSDAIGGVVNIILKKDYRGADTSVRYGDVTRGSRHEEIVAQTLGTNWSSGNIVGTLQYQNESSLPAYDRDFASALPSPSDLLPSTRSYGGTLNGRQTLSDGLELRADVLLSKREFAGDMSEADPGGILVTTNGGNAVSASVAPGLRFAFTPRWAIELNGLFSEQKGESSLTSGFHPGTLTDQFIDNKSTEKSVDLIANGRLGATRGGVIGLAIGTSYRREELNSLDVFMFNPGSSTTTFREQRNITAAFGELYVPIVSNENRIPMVEALEVSAAARLDRYSDFGNSTNPHFGLRWTPLSDIRVRASYGKSFRAPSLVQEFESAPINNVIYNYPFANPAGPGNIPVLVFNGSKPLTPERAQTVDFGVEYNPAAIPGLDVALNYYDVLYKNRIITAPFDTNALLSPAVYGSLITPIASDAAAQAIVDAAQAAGERYVDVLGTGVTGIRYLYDDRQQNATAVRQSGFDFTSKFVKAFAANTLTVQLNASFIDKIETTLAPGAAAIDLVNTFGNPVKWRARLETAWATSLWSVSGSLNSVGSYTNLSGIGNPPIASWSTVNLGAAINADAYFRSPAWKGVTVSLAALNIFDRDPPFVNASSQLVNVNYDPANANPLGRFVSLAVRKKW
jgi:iron complex outermembrane receptor protein